MLVIACELAMISLSRCYLYEPSNGLRQPPRPRRLLQVSFEKKTTELFESSIALALPIVVVNLVDSKAFLSPLVASSKRGR